MCVGRRLGRLKERMGMGWDWNGIENREYFSSLMYVRVGSHFSKNLETGRASRPRTSET